VRFYYAGCPGGHPIPIVFNKIITITAAIYHHIEMESPQSEIANCFCYDNYYLFFFICAAAKLSTAIYRTAATGHIAHVLPQAPVANDTAR